MLMTDHTKPNRRSAYRLAGLVGCDPRTALKWLAGGDVQPVVDYALKMAAAQLGIARKDQGGADVAE